MSPSGDPVTGRLLRISLLVALTVPAALAANLANIPAAWLVAPLVVSVIVAVAAPGMVPEIPAKVRTAAQAIIGVVLAAGFRPETLPLVAREWLPVSLAILGTLTLSLLSGLMLHRLTDLDARTALVGAMPGAAPGMLAMSESVGADPRVVAVMQYGRVVLVVLVATVVARLTGAADAPLSPQDAQSVVSSPPLVYLVFALVAAAGAWLGLKSRLPSGALLGPILLGVVVEESGLVSLSPPPVVPEMAFATIGAYAGLLFDRDSLVRVSRLLPYLILSNLLLMAACSLLGLALARILGTDPLTAYLSTTPGGLDSVAVLALDGNADISLVTAIQTLRIFAVIVAGAALGRFLSRKSSI